jgi:hypothetical protein
VFSLHGQRVGGPIDRHVVSDAVRITRTAGPYQARIVVAQHPSVAAWRCE